MKIAWPEEALHRQVVAGILNFEISLAFFYTLGGSESKISRGYHKAREAIDSDHHSFAQVRFLPLLGWFWVGLSIGELWISGLERTV